MGNMTLKIQLSSAYGCIDDIRMQSRKCNVTGCNGTVRPAQATCDCCRRKFIMDPVFRVMLKRQGITPD